MSAKNQQSNEIILILQFSATLIIVTAYNHKIVMKMDLFKLKHTAIKLFCDKKCLQHVHFNMYKSQFYAVFFSHYSFCTFYENFMSEVVIHGFLLFGNRNQIL